MFKFEAKFLLKKAFITQGSKLTFEFTGHAQDIMDGKLVKKHDDGEVPRSVVLASLKGEVEFFYSGAADNPNDHSTVHLYSLGKAIKGMLDGRPGDPNTKERPVGSDVHIRLPALLLEDGDLRVLSVFPVSQRKYDEAKKFPVSLAKWSELYQEETENSWPVDAFELAGEEVIEKEKVRKKKEEAAEITRAKQEVNKSKKNPEVIKKLRREIASIGDQIYKLTIKIEAKGTQPKEVTRCEGERDKLRNQLSILNQKLTELI